MPGRGRRLRLPLRRHADASVGARASKVLIAIALVLLAACVVAASVFLRSRPTIADTVEPVGPFEIVTHTIRYTTGWNQGPIGTATTEQYSVRYRGEPLPIEGRAGMFGDKTARYERVNSAITFPTAEPAFVVNVGDPNNSSFYYLLRERDGKAEATYLGDSHGGVSADWLDAPASAPNRNLTLHRGRLEGGRLLLLGEYCVLDTETLESYRFEQHRGASLSQFKLPLALSPDRRSFVRLAYDDENAETLVVFDFVAGRSYTLPIDRSVMRFGTPEEIDAVWLDHYFEWTGEGLAARKNVAPLPYRGQLTVDSLDSYREYRVQPVAPEMAARMVDFLRRDFGAELLPREQYQASDTLRIGDRKVHVFSSDDHVGVFMDRGTDSTLVEEIARRFDEVLRTGEHDELFLP